MHQSWLFDEDIDSGDNPLVKGNSGSSRMKRKGFFPSGRLLNVTWLPDVHPYPPRLRTTKCWFVIWADKLNSSVQVCLAGSLHDYVTLPQVHNSFLIFMMGFLIESNIFSLLFFLFFFNNRKKNHDRNSQSKFSLPCISDRLQCSFFVSQVNTVKYIRWMIFNSYPLLVVQCNTLETMQ